MYSMLVLGIVGAGGRFTGCNPAYTTSELDHQVRLTNAKFLITEPELLPKVATVVETLGVSSSNVFVLDNTGPAVPPDWSSVSELMIHGESNWVKFHTAGDAKNTTAALLLTSGTTGLPKAAMISHYSLVMLNILLNDSGRKPYDVASSFTPLQSIRLADSLDRYQDSSVCPCFTCIPSPLYISRHCAKA